MGPKLVCVGTLHTLMAFAALTLYSLQPNPNLDLSTMGNVLLTSLTCLTVGTIVNSFVKIRVMDNVIGGLLAILSSVYIAYDTKLIVGGKHQKHAYSEKEYILAALTLYQDVASLFVQILQILSRFSREED